MLENKLRTLEQKLDQVCSDILLIDENEENFVMRMQYKDLIEVLKSKMMIENKQEKN